MFLRAAVRVRGRGLSLAVFLSLLASACAHLSGPALLDADHPLAERIYDPASGKFIDEAELLSRAAGAEVLLLGETHDNPRHHEIQLQILRTRLSAGARPALAMEQFDTDQQAAVDAALRAGGDLSPLMRGWDWRLYQPLVAAARGADLPLVAANLARERLRPIVREGYATLRSGELERLALDRTWDDARENFLAGVIRFAHCNAIRSELRDGLVRAQRLRDATLADAVLPAIERGVVFILGRGHARRDIGVPHYLATRRPGTRMLSIGLVEVSATKTAPTQYESERVGEAAAFDILWFTPRAERPDPCLAFAKPSS